VIRILLVALAGALATFLLRRPKVYVRNNILIGPDRSYPLTQTDLLWLKRAIVGEVESGNPAPIIWALAQNFLLVDRAHYFPTFTDLIRAYSQPVNASWADANSDKCRSHPEACTAQRMARRARIQSLTSFSPRVEQAVAQFMAGSLPNPIPGLVDWKASPWQGGVIEIEGNWYGVSPERRMKNV